MELILTRVCKNKDYTEGRIEIDGTTELRSVIHWNLPGAT